MKKLISKILSERWHLHIVAGLVFGLIMFVLLSVLGAYSSTRSWEEFLIQLFVGSVLGLFFELIQHRASYVYYKHLELLYRYKIIPRNNKTVVSIEDAVATGIGFALIVPLIYIFI